MTMNIPTIDPQRALELGDPIQCPQCGQPLARRVTTNLKYDTIKLRCDGPYCPFAQVIHAPRGHAEQAYTVSVTIRPPATTEG